jgi:hypothetical protein
MSVARPVFHPEAEVHPRSCYVAKVHERDLPVALTDVRNWESNGLNAHVAFGPFMTPDPT